LPLLRHIRTIRYSNCLDSGKDGDEITIQVDEATVTSHYPQPVNDGHSILGRAHVSSRGITREEVPTFTGLEFTVNSRDLRELKESPAWPLVVHLKEDDASE